MQAPSTASSSAPASATSPPPTPTPTAGATFPLTGQPAPTTDAASRPIVAVPVDSGSGLPGAVGLTDADVALVAFPSPQRQRVLALFQSRDSARVGPVAQTRPLDGKVLHALGSVLEYAGGTYGFVTQVAAAGLPQWSSVVHPSSFATDPRTGALFCATAAARAAVGALPGRPGLLPFGGSTPGATPPPTVRVQVSGQPLLTLTYDQGSGTWRGALTGGLSVVATNVLVQQVTYDRLVLPKTGDQVEGNPDPNGQGAATLLFGPQVDTGSWNRPGGGTSTKYVRSDGTAVRLVPGATWVLLVPVGTSVQTS